MTLYPVFSDTVSVFLKADQAARIKADKIKLALEKIREANVKKLFIKAFMGDGSTKSLLVDEKMSCGHVTRLLADKNHVRMEPRWAITEFLPELLMGQWSPGSVGHAAGRFRQFRPSCLGWVWVLFTVLS